MTGFRAVRIVDEFDVVELVEPTDDGGAFAPAAETEA